MSQGPVPGPLELELELVLACELELVVDPEPVLDPELAVDPEAALEPELVPEVELVPFCRTMVPVTVGLVLSGVTVSVVPETQYAYAALSEVVNVLPDVVRVPLAVGLADTSPIPPDCATVPVQLHPPLEASVQSTDE
jgi:hypothetical protein